MQFSIIRIKVCRDGRHVTATLSASSVSRATPPSDDKMEGGNRLFEHDNSGDTDSDDDEEDDDDDEEDDDEDEEGDEYQGGRDGQVDEKEEEDNDEVEVDAGSGTYGDAKID